MVCMLQKSSAADLCVRLCVKSMPGPRHKGQIEDLWAVKWHYFGPPGARRKDAHSTNPLPILTLISFGGALVETAQTSVPWIIPIKHKENMHAQDGVYDFSGKEKEDECWNNDHQQSAERGQVWTFSWKLLATSEQQRVSGHWHPGDMGTNGAPGGRMQFSAKSKDPLWGSQLPWICICSQTNVKMTILWVWSQGGLSKVCILDQTFVLMRISWCHLCFAVAGDSQWTNWSFVSARCCACWNLNAHNWIRCQNNPPLGLLSWWIVEGCHNGF